MGSHSESGEPLSVLHRERIGDWLRRADYCPEAWSEVWPTVYKEDMGEALAEIDRLRAILALHGLTDTGCS